MIDFEQYDFNIFEKKKQKKRQKIEKFSVNPLDGDIIIMVEDNLEVLLDYIKRDKELMNFFKYNYPNRVLCHLKLMSLLIEMCFNLQTSFEYVKSNIDRMLIPLMKEEQTNESLILFCGHRANKKNLFEKILNSNVLSGITCDNPFCTYKQYYFDIHSDNFTEEIKYKYQLLLKNKFVKKYSSFYFSCINKNCNKYYLKGKNTKDIYCLCGTNFCNQCKHKAHNKIWNCSEMKEIRSCIRYIKRLNPINQSSFINDKIYFAKYIHKCPTCKSNAYRDGGCDNVCCTVCKSKFTFGYEYNQIKKKFLPIDRTNEVKKWTYIQKELCGDN